MAKEVKLNMVISALDKFSAPFRKLESAIENVENKFSLLGKTKAATKMKDLSSSLGDVGEKSSTLLGRIGALTAGVSALFGGVVALTNQTAKAGLEIQRLSTFAGITTNSMQKLMYAGKSVNLETEELGMQMGTLAEHLVDAANGNEELADLFSSLGIEVKDSSGQIKKTDIVLLEMADAFAQMEDGPVKTALAIRLFGDAGSKLLPLLNKGSTSIQNMGKEAENLGSILSDDAIKNSQSFTAQLSRLTEMITSLAQNIASSLMPAVIEIIQKFSAWMAINKLLIQEKISAWLQNFIEKIPTLISGLESFFTAIGNILSALTEFSKLIGGVENLLIALGVIMAGPLLIAIAGAIKGFIALGLAMMANPVGAVIAGIMAIVGTIIYFKKEIVSAYKWLADLFSFGGKEVDVKIKADVDTSSLKDFEKAQLDYENQKKSYLSANPFSYDPSATQDEFNASLNGSRDLDVNKVSSRSAENRTSHTETKIERNEIKLILPPNVKATGHENADSVSVDTSYLGNQNTWR